MWLKTIAVVVGLLLVWGAWLVVCAARHPAIAPIARPAAASFDPARVKRGATLAAIGNCATCHTAPGGEAFAGGVAIPALFGTIFSTNISPDAETGIGAWSEAAFQRAMRKGVHRDGVLLYPAFPYDHFAFVSDDDIRALYAFLMTRPPVHQTPPANDLPFPFNHRVLVAGWNVLFLRPTPPSVLASHDASVARGAYLVEGLGHCGSCHTPRNFLGAEKSGAAFAGATIDGWTAYALNARSPAAVPWTADALYQYLREGFEPQHGIARGPMAEVVANLRAASDDDVSAIANYVAAQVGRPTRRKEQIQLTLRAGQTPARQKADFQTQRGTAVAASSGDSQAYRGVSTGILGTDEDEGAVIYVATCAGCHQGPRAMPFGGISLGLSSAISGPSPDYLVNIILHGIPATEASRSPIMPGFANVLDDEQVGALVRYLRTGFADKDTWSGIEEAVRAARGAKRSAAVSDAERQARE